MAGGATPSTRAMGQGAAQVFDTSGLANQFAQQEGQKAQAKYTAQKDLEKKIAEITAKGSEIWKEKYFATRDDKMLRGKYKTEILDWMKGKAHLVADPSTPEAQEYNERLQNLMFDFKQSQESKELAKPFMDDFGLNPTEYEPETAKYFHDFMTTEGMVFDPTKIKKVNNFDVWGDAEKRKQNFEQDVKNNPTNTGLIPLKDGGYAYGTNVFATPEKRKAFVDDTVGAYSVNPQATDMINRQFADEAKELGILPMEVFANRLYDKTAIDIKDRSYTGLGGKDKKEPFNPANIVDTAEIKTNKYVLTDWFGSNEVLTDKTQMYQTGEVNGVVPISKDVIDMNTGKAVQDIGTYDVKMGSPMVYKGKLMVPATYDVKTNSGMEHISVLIPANEVREQYLEQDGTDLSQVADNFGVPFGGGLKVKSTTSKTGGAY